MEALTVWLSQQWTAICNYRHVQWQATAVGEGQDQTSDPVLEASYRLARYHLGRYQYMQGDFACTIALAKQRYFEGREKPSEEKAKQGRHLEFIAHLEMARTVPYWSTWMGVNGLVDYP